jgi:hypothetical protein
LVARLCVAGFIAASLLAGAHALSQFYVVSVFFLMPHHFTITGFWT